MIPNCTLFIISDIDIDVTGLLNSVIIQSFFPQICPKVRGEFMRFKSMYVEQIPIPTVSEPDRLVIEALVQKCLDAKGQGVQEWEAEIDGSVGNLYGLTADEMKIIRRK